MGSAVRYCFFLALSVFIHACGGGGGGASNNGGGGSASIYTIAGVVAGRPGTVVTISGASTASTTVDSSGRYVFTQLKPGVYTITPSYGAWAFSPGSLDVTIGSANVQATTIAVAGAPEGLTDAELANLETVPPYATQREDLRFDDGTDMLNYLESMGVSFQSGALAREQAEAAGPTTSEERLKVLIATLMTRAAHYACGRSGSCVCSKPPCANPWIKEADSGDPDIKPAQAALGYVWNATDPKVRTDPAKWGSKCKQHLYAFDCSGLLKRVAADAGLLIGKGSDTQSRVETWTNAIPTEWGITTVKVTDGKYLKGDIIYWAPPSDGEAGHVGIAMGNGTDPQVISSVGGLHRCDYNYDKGGPVSYRMATIRAALPAYALRLVADNGCPVADPNTIRPPRVCFRSGVALTPGTPRPISDFLTIDRGNDPLVTSIYVGMGFFRGEPNGLTLSGIPAFSNGSSYYYGRELDPFYTSTSGTDIYYSCQGLPNPHPDVFDKAKLNVPIGFVGTSVELPVFIVQYQRKLQSNSCESGGYLPFERVNIEDCPSGETARCTPFVIPIQK